jgi:hypothetical protein
MIDDNIPAGFTDLDTSFTQHQESIRDAVALLLGAALHACSDDQRAHHVERAFMIYEDLAAMHGLFWKVMDLMDGGEEKHPGEKVPGPHALED